MEPDELLQALRQTHKALNDLTSLFVFRAGADYNAVEAAIQAMRKNTELDPGLPITAALLEI